MWTKNWFLHNPTFKNSTDTKNIRHSVFHGLSLLPRQLCLQNSQKQFLSSPVGSSLPKRNHSSAFTPVLCKIRYISISIPYNKLLTDIGNKIYFGKTHFIPPPHPCIRIVYDFFSICTVRGKYSKTSSYDCNELNFCYINTWILSKFIIIKILLLAWRHCKGTWTMSTKNFRPIKI